MQERLRQGSLFLDRSGRQMAGGAAERAKRWGHLPLPLQASQFRIPAGSRLLFPGLSQGWIGPDICNRSDFAPVTRSWCGLHPPKLGVGRSCPFCSTREPPCQSMSNVEVERRPRLGDSTLTLTNHLDSVPPTTYPNKGTDHKHINKSFAQYQHHPQKRLWPSGRCVPSKAHRLRVRARLGSLF